MKTVAIYAAELLGAALIVHGVYAVYAPAGAIFAGAFLILAAFALDR